MLKRERKTGFRFLLFALFSVFMNSVTALASSDVKSGVGLFEQRCVACHNGSVQKAPSREAFRDMSPHAVYNTLKNGIMAPMASGLEDNELALIAEYLTGKSLKKAVAFSPAAYCSASEGWFEVSKSATISGGGMTGNESRRFIPKEIAKLSAAEVGKLQVKWAFGFPDAIRARSQPAILGGTLYTGSEDGTVYALDQKSGCIRWTFKASNVVRTAITAGTMPSERKKEKQKQPPAIYFGDQSANVYAIDAVTGKLRWKKSADEQPMAHITGSITFNDGVLYVPVAAFAQGGAAVCCQHRGAVVALDASTGDIIWKQYTIPDPAEEQYKNANGTPHFGPSGASVWSAPTLDLKRRRLYVGTGENNSSPAVNGSAIIAMDMDDGHIVWVMQTTPGEAYNSHCPGSGHYEGDDSECPKEYRGRIGLDYAGGAPVLFHAENGQDIIIAAQKTGWVFGLNPEDGGKVLWRRAVSRGDYNKANWFGLAVEGDSVFVAVNDLYAAPRDGDYLGQEELGIYALDALTGKWRWFAPVSRDCLKDRCRGYGSALTAIPGAVIAGSQDGYLRILDSKTGALLWQNATAHDYETINGVTAKGGTIGGQGAVVADGMLYINSGYLYLERDLTGNALLAFSIDGK